MEKRGFRKKGTREMNANELADALQETEPYYSTDYKLFDKAAAMLRQQAKELDEAGHMIGVLREQLQEEIQARADALDDLNSRMMKFMKSYNEMAYKLEEVGGAYTHPVKEQDTDCQYCKQGCIRCDARKQLTDEEIQLLINDVRDYDIDTHDLFEFARAILRKAQEK
jgi:cell fate (sporulation/competence/biofilm development) regulator YlbF (YheA/YmcA/DUF963 family)